LFKSKNIPLLLVTTFKPLGFEVVVCIYALFSDFTMLKQNQTVYSTVRALFYHY